MICPVCMFVPEIDRELTAARVPGLRIKRPEADRWLEYVAHLLEHLVELSVAEPQPAKVDRSMEEKS